jgi:hypothetical protein
VILTEALFPGTFLWELAIFTRLSWRNLDAEYENLRIRVRLSRSHPTRRRSLRCNHTPIPLFIHGSDFRDRPYIVVKPRFPKHCRKIISRLCGFVPQKNSILSDALPSVKILHGPSVSNSSVDHTHNQPRPFPKALRRIESMDGLVFYQSFHVCLLLLCRALTGERERAKGGGGVLFYIQ